MEFLEVGFAQGDEHIVDVAHNDEFGGLLGKGPIYWKSRGQNNPVFEQAVGVRTCLN
jgi:hypothetical protein